MEVIKKVERFIFESSLWRLIALVFATIFFKTGVWYIPNLDASQAIAQNPFVNPLSDPNAHYLFWSWLGPFIAWLIGAKSKFQFFAFHLVFAFAFTLLFIRISFLRFTNEVARSSTILFVILPVSATSFFWVGSDSIVLFLMLLALAFPQGTTVVFLVGAMLGMQNFEQGFFATAGLLLSVLISNKQGDSIGYSPKFCILFFMGVIAGKFALIAIFKYYGIEVNSGRVFWLLGHINILLSEFVFHFNYIIWSVLGLGWVVALRFADCGRAAIPFFFTLAGLCLLLPFSGDQTRVLAIVTFPLIAVYWLFNPLFLEKITRREIALIFTIWAIMPWGWVWGGRPMWSVFPYDIAYILHWMFGWFDVPADPALWPF